MIELEIQALSERREGLLIEVGRLVLASGFTLQRQRLVQDPHGILLTMVVRGPPRKRRALAAALDAYERIISFELESFVEGEERAHFAASRAASNYIPAPAPMEAPPVAAAVAAPAPPPAAPRAEAFDKVEPVRLAPSAPAAAPVPRTPPPAPEPDFEFILPAPRRTPAPPPAVVEPPFVELVPLDPDQAAVDQLQAKLESEYPQIMSRLLALDATVAEAAREPTLALAGRRVGGWLARRAPAAATPLALTDAIERIGLPALRALAEVEQDGNQLHIRHSPLCGADGHSGCVFFSGLLEALLGPALGASQLTIFPVCCRSYGADDCVLDLSD